LSLPHTFEAEVEHLLKIRQQRERTVGRLGDDRSFRAQDGKDKPEGQRTLEGLTPKRPTTSRPGAQRVASANNQRICRDALRPGAGRCPSASRRLGQGPFDSGLEARAAASRRLDWSIHLRPLWRFRRLGVKATKVAPHGQRRPPIAGGGGPLFDLRHAG